MLCRAQSTLGGLHTRDEGWQDDSKRRDPTLPPSSNFSPQTISTRGNSHVLVLTDAASASDRRALRSSDRWSSSLLPTGDSQLGAVTEQDTPPLPHRLCRAAPSRSSRNRPVDVARGSSSYFQPPPILNMAARRAGKWCLELARGNAALASIGNFLEVKAAHDCSSATVGRAPWYPGLPQIPRGAAGLLALLQGARTRYLCLFEPGWAHPPCRSMMMYSSRDPVSAANVITWLCPDLTPPGLTKQSRQEQLQPPWPWLRSGRRWVGGLPVVWPD